MESNLENLSLCKTKGVEVLKTFPQAIQDTARIAVQQACVVKSGLFSIKPTSEILKSIEKCVKDYKSFSDAMLESYRCIPFFVTTNNYKKMHGEYMVRHRAYVKNKKNERKRKE